jgi:hypothetical protein
MACVAEVLSEEADMTKKLLQLGDNYHWQLEGIEFAIFTLTNLQATNQVSAQSDAGYG